VRVLAEVFGWEGDSIWLKGDSNIIIRYVDLDGKETSVMFVESEVEHVQKSAREYFKSLCKRLAKRTKDYRSVKMNVNI